MLGQQCSTCSCLRAARAPRPFNRRAACGFFAGSCSLACAGCIVLQRGLSLHRRPANAQCPVLRDATLPPRRPHKLSAEEEGERELRRPERPLRRCTREKKKFRGAAPAKASRRLPGHVSRRSDRRSRGPPRIQHLAFQPPPSHPPFPFPLFIRGALPDVRVVRARARSAGPFWGRCRALVVLVRLVSARHGPPRKNKGKAARVRIGLARSVQRPGKHPAASCGPDRESEFTEFGTVLASDGIA